MLHYTVIFSISGSRKFSINCDASAETNAIKAGIEWAIAVGRRFDKVEAVQNIFDLKTKKP